MKSEGIKTDAPIDIQDRRIQIQGLNGLHIFRTAFERIVRLSELNNIYSGINSKDNQTLFLDKLLESLHVKYNVSGTDIKKIPEKGPAIVVSNHPFGGIDGIILSRILLSVRPDVKVMANYILKGIPELASLFIAVDPFGKKGSVTANASPLRKALKWLKDGGLLCVFPAGEVSHMHISKGIITDSKWNPMIARIIEKTRSPVLPVYFDGHNGVLFQCLGMFHPLLRTIMLPGEMVRKRGKEKIELKIGNSISYESLRHFQSDDDMMTFIRLRTYMLRNRNKKPVERDIIPWKRIAKNKMQIIAPQSSGLLSWEICNLRDENTLIKSGEFCVILAHARQIPNILREIGRIREITFRGVGEGTGRTLDIDQFDDRYLHMFLWNDKNGEIAGAYRLGLTDHILMRHGIKGLYSRTLFHYGMPLLQQINPAIELGRSFIRPEYQKSYQPLLLLWQGIAQFVFRNPRYKLLFGPVSITREYDEMSIHLMVNYLKRNSYNPELGRLVRPKKSMGNNFRGIEIGRVISSLSELSDLTNLVSDIEKDHKGIPILLKHYLKMGAKVLAFNVDKKFSNVIDALILVDLTRTEKKLLERHMGKNEAVSFLNYHHSDNLKKCA